MLRQAAVEAGVTTTMDFNLRVGDVRESVTVEAASPQMHYDSHTVGGLIRRNQIQDLPLNGRSFLALAKLEPGILQQSVERNMRLIAGPVRFDCHAREF